MPMSESQVERGNRAGGGGVLLRLVHLAAELFTEELRHETVDRIAEHENAATPQPAQAALILHCSEMRRLLLFLGNVDGVDTALRFLDNHLHPWLGVGLRLEEFVLNIGLVELDILVV